MKPMPNPIPRRYIETNPELTPAFDAFESQDPRALSLCVGMPCTYSIGSDDYAGVVTSVDESRRSTPTVTAQFGNLGLMAFRPHRGKKNPRWYVIDTTRKRVGVGYLTIGVAEDFRDPAF